MIFAMNMKRQDVIGAAEGWRLCYDLGGSWTDALFNSVRLNPQ